MFPFDTYESDGAPIITPEKFYPKERKVSDVAVVCFSTKARDHVLANNKAELIKQFHANANGEIPIYYLPEYGVVFFMSLIGASMAGEILQEIAYVFGVTKFVYFGSCGVLDESLLGRFIVPSECYREEGYSFHHAAPSEYLPIENHAKVASFLASLGVPYSVGKGWTTDDIYDETIAKWQKRKQEGVLCVDMEASGLQAIASRIGVALYLFFFASDVLGDTWVRGDLGGAKERVRQIDSAEVALALGESLTR